MESLDHMVTLCFIFEKSSTGAVPFYIGADNAQGFQLSQDNTCPLFVSVLFASSHSRGCDVVCHCTFHLHFLMISDAEHLAMCLLATYIFSLEQPFIWKVYYPQSTGWWSI